MDFGPDARILGAPPLPASVDELLVVAAEQHGLVTRPQCLAAGLTDKAIRWRLERGWWVVLHHGVYLTEPGRNDWYTRAIGAQVAVPDAAWSHHTAGFVHGLLRRPPSMIELVVDAERHVTAPSGVIVRRRCSVNRSVDDLHWPWRTTAAETLLDLADAGTADELFAMLGRAFQRSLTSEAELRRVLALRRAHRWRSLLDAVLVDVADGAESTMEVRYVRDVERAHGLPAGRRQVAAPGGGLERHDVAYEEQRVLVELDGRLGHEGREERIRDGRRDRRGATVGWLTVRGFWTDVAVTPCAFATDVGAVLATRGWRGRPRRCRRRSCPVGR
jgi:predicted transcriptional regulator of viral defense system